ncbi:hypothetical protein G9P44_002174 [Scheffersomyces stipitis]|nr:hypothetical protein G9P44_002174 [Scheffersomyces stipitis]
MKSTTIIEIVDLSALILPAEPSKGTTPDVAVDSAPASEELEPSFSTCGIVDEVEESAVGS